MRGLLLEGFVVGYFGEGSCLVGNLAFRVRLVHIMITNVLIGSINRQKSRQ